MVITTLYDWSLLTYTKLEIILLHFIVEWSDNKFIWTVLFTPSSFRSSQETLMAVKWSNTSFYLSSQQISWGLLLKNVKLPTFVAWEWKSMYQVRTMKKNWKKITFVHPSAHFYNEVLLRRLCGMPLTTFFLALLALGPFHFSVTASEQQRQRRNSQHARDLCTRSL